ncbi:hypothetical protein BSR29_01015 [Boudabousia liubingyangii]|uniref:Uncharacterized protein n=1 Tax=Boudabousia liubingyangii TaxID=1921764 RepID=A0A1Q5PPY9_9ACTO|nr:hypothetical protein [Boudabousia liubingyangii]OKL49569.1 hypothetical protein BSR29_01015 [Boudabousia liubingyangii]
MTSSDPKVKTDPDRSLQYQIKAGKTGEIGIVVETEAVAGHWLSIPKSALVMLLSATAVAILVVLGAYVHRDILTVLAVACAAIISLGLPRSIGAPAPRYSSTVALIFSLVSVATVRRLDDLYIAGIIFALSVVAAFGAEMARKDGRARLLDSVSTTVLTTAAAISSVAIVGLAPHGSWKLALVATSICVAISMGIFQLMRMFWAGTAQWNQILHETELEEEDLIPGNWRNETTGVYRVMNAVNHYWGITDTARTVNVLLTGVVGAALAGALYQTGVITGRNADALQKLGQYIGGGAVPALVVGLFVGLLSGLIVIISGRVLRPTSPRVSLWASVAWGVLPVVLMAMPTYALVRMGS